MKRGPKPRQSHDDGGSGKPVMPEYLRKIPAAQDVWFEEIERVIARGISAEHSSTFATYCILESSIRSIAVTGVLPTAAVFSERRKLAELLGIAGLSSRTPAGAVDPLKADANPYGALPDA